jgi:uncharacterized damage-inducible protein DinB
MESDLLANFRWLARYNAWFNERLFDACERLDDSERKRDRGAFFGSIHRTLNHLAVADQIWLLRLRQCATEHGLSSAALSAEVLDLPPGQPLNQPLFDDWAMLRAKRRQLDSAIAAWLGEVPPAFVLSSMRYANSAGVQRSHPAWQALAHCFNHQTHHRGQVSTLLMQAGIDVGVTDMIALVSAP